MAVLRNRTEKAIHWLFLGIATVSIGILVLIMFFLFQEGLPIFKTVTLQEFVMGHYWYPTDDPADFGIFPLIVASLFVTLLSAVISIPLGVMTAVYLSEIASRKIAELVKPVVELLAALPSVVIGFFGMVLVGPFLQKTFGIPIGLNLFNAGLMLAFMSIPTICSIAEDALYSVPNSLREASLALGATELETIVKVIVPAGLSGICTAIILGMSRAIGETMVVLMVAGGAAMLPGSIFDPVRPMPASIAAEMAEAPFRGEHYHALFAIGIVLFLFTLAFNLVADQIAQRYRQSGEASL
ncbi:phosphate ABC transporter membrane protein 1 (PhoT family) [Desulfobotulus alkaliphilus]|uniref:Phosphate transport system permease protein n=1 Tax=Desulfobotulus alkaliphilus TaxID=622671 RepID=A0A562RRE4_9BACT|nr:phosphate ABC transporter permease subunit PstC [Desulfobotulus alkaliphilus]TWI71651.1 phosphate ABC transporter membrane protein 1 (PhoT family) [Desulfobotulus alkaliphilus]